MMNLKQKISIFIALFALTISGANASYMEVSETESLVFPAEQVVKSSNNFAFINTKLVDESGFPVAGHELKLISSSSDDEVEYYSTNLTNDVGEMMFRVSSSKGGPVTYSVYDVTSDTVLKSKAKVLYFSDKNYVFENSNVSLAAGSSSSSVDEFEFKDVPSSLKTGESATFTLEAQDALGQTVTNYTGKVRFSVVSGSSSNVTLPPDYTFTFEDQGSHTFSLAMKFLLPGTYEIEVRDLTNFAIFGKKVFTVSSSTSGGGQVNNVLQITNPIAGTYSNKTQVINGKSKAGAKLNIYDGELKLTSLVADVNGAFSYTVSNLSDGDHDFKVVEVDANGKSINESAVVKVKIDTSAPLVSKVEFEPLNPVPGSSVKLKLYTGEKLLQAAALFENNIYQLSDSGAGYYQTSFSVPSIAGPYDVDFILVDELGNESRLNKASTVQVGGASSKSAVLGDVSGVTAKAADHRVTLNWKAPTTSVNGIANYRVFYGLSPSKLSEAVDTLTDSTTWYIPNLKNGVKYYFAVSAVDKKGEISAHLSNIVDATPNPVVAVVDSPEVASGTAGNEAFNDTNADISETGPEALWLVIIAMIGTAFYTSSMKRRVEIKERVW